MVYITGGYIDIFGELYRDNGKEHGNYHIIIPSPLRPRLAFGDLRLAAMTPHLVGFRVWGFGFKVWGLGQGIKERIFTIFDYRV